MKVYFDANIPQHLAKAFHDLQFAESLNIKGKFTPIQVSHIRTEFGDGAKDPDWLLAMPKYSYVVTKDFHISRRKDEIDAYLKNKAGLFILRGKNSKENPTVWQQLFILAKHWEEMTAIMKKRKGPFAYLVSAQRGVKKYQ